MIIIVIITNIFNRGLDNAGKSSIIQSILGETNFNKIIPTMGFEINTIKFKKFQLNIWDIGGQLTLRSFWFNYFDGLNSLIWVIDTSNLQRIIENFNEFYNILQNEKLINIKLLIYLNKIDLVGGGGDEIKEIKEKIKNLLKLNEIDDNKWAIYECSIYDKDSIERGLNWLCDNE